MERRLTAILAADVVGYSRMMAADEQGTLSRLTAVQSQLIEPLVAEYRGRVFKTMGDGFLVAYASVVDAVNCAVAWQEQLQEWEPEIDNAARLRFRIGINVGDVMVVGEDLYGNGVNVAARLEGLAPVGGICLSAMVQQNIKDKLSLAFESIGPQSLKNIAEPMEAFVLRIDDAPDAKADDGAIPVTAPLEQPVIAVMPFVNMSGDAEQDYFADGITEDILTSLSRFPEEITVIDRYSSFTYKGKSETAKRIGEQLGVDYILEGSVRRTGERLRISAKLIECASGSQLWAERYDRALENIFEIQDEITRHITTALSVELVYGTYTGNWMRGTEVYEAWDAMTKGAFEFLKFTREGFQACFEEAERAIRADPSYGTAYAVKGWCLASTARYFASDPAPYWAGAQEAYEKAMSIPASRIKGLALKGFCQMYQGNLDVAIPSLKEAIAHAPTAENHFLLGQAYLYLGRAKDSIAQTEQAMRLSPLCPGYFLFNLIESYRILGDMEQALRWADVGITKMPGSPVALVRKAGLLALADRQQEAALVVEQILAREPDFSLTTWEKGHPFRQAEHIEPFVRALRRLGLP